MLVSLAQHRRQKRVAWAFLALIALMFALGAMVIFLPGCAAMPSSQEARQTLDDFKAEEAKLKAQLADLRAQAATRPSDKIVVDTIDRITNRLNVLDTKVLPAADALVRSYERGSPDASLSAALATFGPWGALASVLLPVGWGIYERIQKQRANKALQQTVKALDQTPLTPDQALNLSIAQDESTKAKVNEIRALPEAPSVVVVGAPKTVQPKRRSK